jgi:hypothetical protein
MTKQEQVEDEDLRTKCLELAAEHLGGDSMAAEVVARARKFYRFIKGAGEKPPVSLQEARVSQSVPKTIHDERSPSSPKIL